MSAQLTFACPRCGYKVDAATAVGDEPIEAQPGDLSLCLWCAAPLELAADQPPRWLTFEELRALAPRERAQLGTAVLAIITTRPSRVRYVKP